MSAFRDNLARDPDDPTFQYLFHVHGIGGVGKTSLVRQWDNAARELGAATVYIDDDVHTVLEAMESIGAQLGRQDLPLKAFDKLLGLYRQRRHEAEGAPAQLPPGAGDDQPPAASVSSTVLTRAGLAGLNLLPGATAFTGSLDAQQLALGADRLRAALSARFRSHDDVQLVMSPLKALTPVLLDGLADAAQQRRRLVLFFDVFERIGPVLDEWLRDLLVTGRYGDLPFNVIAVLSGQGHLNPRYWNDHLDLITSVPLDVFTEQETRQLLASRGVTDEQVIQIILNLSGGMPLQVDLLAQTPPGSPADIGDATDTAVERFLKWTDAPDRRAAAQACAFPLQLDEDIYRAAVPDATADHYTWLRGQPFVQDHAGRARYHDVVRTAMLRLQRNQSPSEWQNRHTRLADAFADQRRSLESGLPSDRHRDDPEWREHRFNEIYHQLCAGPHRALSDVLAEIVKACDETPDALPRWTQTLLQAYHDTDHPGLGQWATRLTATPGLATKPVAALTAVLSASLQEITAEVRTLAHTVRGREHRNTGLYTQALADYTAALDLTSDFERAHYGLGETHRLMGRHRQALADFTRALELKPDDPWTYLGRAQSHWALGENQQALEDLGRMRTSRESDPDHVWILRERGLAYRAMEQYEHALADLGRTIDIAPDHAWGIAERGETYRLLEQYEEALTDFDRAIELSPDYFWAIASRGQVYRAMGRYEEALTDLGRAVRLSSGTPWVVAERGLIHLLTERYEDAIADFDRAIELKPDYAWAIGRRGETYRQMTRYEEALTNLDRAVELNPDVAWGIAGRGQVYQAMERYEEALADLDRAIELDPDYSWAFAQRGVSHRLTDRYEDAIADFDRAIELKPDYAWAFAERGETYRQRERYEEALTDFDRAVELSPGYTWAIGQRGFVHRLMGRYDDALADFDRAIELEPDDAWLLCETAVVHRLLDRSDRLERVEQAAESLFRKADDTSDVHELGNLVIVYCVLSRPERTRHVLDRFLRCAPSPARIREALDDLRGMRQAMVDTALCEAVRSRLENALGDR
ncbi:tetratricopeptide repeat protein [Streptomyces sp. NPDC047061]|uniref:tetratricopeptide repeat protein n=1 Tax=Streptomyces sp. NPDC047061 TaxID=3154605 RepID=UPI0033CA7EA9